MKFALKEKLAELDKRLAVRQVGMLPSEAFFCRSAELPQGTAAADISGLAQLQLEAAAPFPVENLAWGYLTGKTSIFIYASTSERAGEGLEKGIEPLWHAFPAFLPFCIEELPMTDAAVRVCLSGHSASAISFNAGENVPAKIVSCRLPQDMPLASDEDILKARAAIVEALGIGAAQNVEQGTWVYEGADLRHDDKVIFKVRHVEAGKARTVERHIAGDALWNADARGRVYARANREDRRKNYMAWIAFSAAGWTAAALFVGTIVLIFACIATGVYHITASKHRAEVDVLQNKSDFATNLESVTDRQMKPIAMLAEASSKRPHGVFYERASANDWNVLRLEGQAQRSELIQAYIEALNKDPVVREVRNLRTTTSGGHSTYDMEIVFKTLEDITTSPTPAK